MLRRSVLVVLLTFVPALAFQAQRAAVERPSPQQDFTIRTTSRLVLLDVSVMDARGGLVSGLAKKNFRIYENGKLQEISEFANADIPVTVGLVVDASGSMRRKRQEVITAALAFITESNPKDEVFVINFNDRVTRGLPEGVLFSDNLSLLRAALSRDPPEGRTALYDAIVQSEQLLDQGRQDKKTLIVISDGGDNVSRHTFKDVMDSILDSTATIYTIGIFDEDGSDSNPGVLKKLARVTGGEAYFPPKLERMVPDCRRIAKDIRTRYTIGYIPSIENGKRLRHIRVAVSGDGRGKLFARARTEYLFSDEPTRGSQ